MNVFTSSIFLMSNWIEFQQLFHPFPVSQRRYIAPPNQAGLKLKTVLGYNGNGRGNMVWHPDSGLFVYTNGSIIIMEDLQMGTQKHLMGKDTSIHHRYWKEIAVASHFVFQPWGEILRLIFNVWKRLNCSVSLSVSNAMCVRCIGKLNHPLQHSYHVCSPYLFLGTGYGKCQFAQNFPHAWKSNMAAVTCEE